ncbi:MAG: rod shape-determining protein MreC, partial [Candidatus Binataceae bacterium]
MRDTFLWRNRVVLVSGVLLLLSAHLLSIGVREGSLAAKPEAAATEMVRPLLLLNTHLTEGASGIYHDYLDLVGISRENRRLKERLARMKGDQTRMAELELENRRLAELLELKDAVGLNVVGADVIGSDATGLARTLIIGRGTAGGLKPNMAVICNDGVVGKLVALSSNAAKVLRVDDHNAAVDAFDERSRARGIVAGVVDNGMVMKYVERTEDVQVGDEVVTSGLDGIFPRGMLLGHVIRIKRGGPGLFLNVEVAP